MLNTILGSLSAIIVATSYESIATVTVGAGGSSSVDFNSIPSTYTHLQIRGIAKSNRVSSTGDNINYRFNSDTANNYATHDIAGNGSIITATATINTSSIGGARIGANTTEFGAVIIDILDYKNTNKFKTTRMLAGMDNNGQGFVSLTSGVWRSTSAITSISLFSGTASTLLQYTQFSLYGIKDS